jgi:mannosyl-oligosaccharide glucosidase
MAGWAYERVEHREESASPGVSRERRCPKRWMLLPLALALLLLHLARAASDEPARTWTWSTYKPNLYFGLKPSLPRSVHTGLLWHGVQSYDALRKVRHTCEQDDGVASFNWIRHDGRTAGEQIIRDEANNVELSTSFLKVEGGPHGGSLTVTVVFFGITPGQVDTGAFV